MKAIIEIEFDKETMCTQDTVDKLYNGSWLEVMQYLFKYDGMGIFENDPKLIKVEE
jgi:hypothetical protein